MATTSPVLLIFGAGPNIGQAVSRTFKARGYKVALVSRSLKEGDSTKDELHVASDLSDPQSVVKAYEKVNKELGIPSVVVYNAYASTPHNPADDQFAVPLDLFAKGLNTNTVSAYAAAQHAVQGFAKLPETASRTFIYTGNILNEGPWERLLVLGTGKTAFAHVIESASRGYKEKGYNFYYADERKADGTAIVDVNGDAHADHFLTLANEKEQGPWQQTFVKGVGYKRFPIAK
ncbi:hypothetical protein IAR55_006894 [Kwoniella newhampshirensis]|uniref:Short-chain dehydrogenase n=1 Tax=Kwoniella newhampshirensis TaxID=1651941 RepID=A0AAW0YGS0_9TREE